MTLPDIDALWNFDFAHVPETEQAFRDLLPLAAPTDALAYRLELLTQIARAQGLQEHFAAAHATLDEVAAQLRDGLVHPRIRYLLERGRVFNSSAHPDEACPWFQQAWELAQREQVTLYAIDAAHMLGIAAPQQERLAWNETALHLAKTADAADTRSRHWCGSLYNNIGWTYHEQGQYDQALASFSQALAWQEHYGDARQVRIARWCVGRTLRSLARYEEALVIQLDVLAAWQHSGTQQDGYVSEEIGECLLALQRQEESTVYFAQAADLLGRDPWFSQHEHDRLARLQQFGQ